MLDSVCFGLQAADLSLGRLADGSWGLTWPTFGSANLPVALGRQESLKINEWLASGAPTAPDDFVELYNPESVPVAFPTGPPRCADDDSVPARGRALARQRP